MRSCAINARSQVEATSALAPKRRPRADAMRTALRALFSVLPLARIRAFPLAFATSSVLDQISVPHLADPSRVATLLSAFAAFCYLAVPPADASVLCVPLSFSTSRPVRFRSFILQIQEGHIARGALRAFLCEFRSFCPLLPRALRALTRTRRAYVEDRCLGRVRTFVSSWFFCSRLQYAAYRARQGRAPSPDARSGSRFLYERCRGPLAAQDPSRLRAPRLTAAPAPRRARATPRPAPPGSEPRPGAGRAPQRPHRATKPATTLSQSGRTPERAARRSVRAAKAPWYSAAHVAAALPRPGIMPAPGARAPRLSRRIAEDVSSRPC